MSHNDPFYESVRELQDLVAKAKLLEHSVANKGFVSSENMLEIEEIHPAAVEVLELLKEMLHVIEARGGKVQGTVFSANEILERQNILRSLNNEVTDMTHFLDRLRSRSAAKFAAVGVAESDPPVRRPDAFLTTQEFEQREEAQQQDEVLDRLSYGLQELRETGVNVHDELDTQDALLSEMERDVSGVQIRLRQANAKVDKLLASMSNKGKVCTIVILILILVFLAFFAFS